MLQVKTLKMTFFFLQQQHHLTLESLPDGRFYERDNSNIVQVHYGCAPVWCEYTDDWTNEGHSWTNPISDQVHHTHPLGLTMSDSSFFDGFYQITKIDGLTFKEGEAWCPDTNQKICVENTNPLNIWNPFFQRYDPPCNGDPSVCDPTKINYDVWNMFHKIFTGDMTTFTKVYCKCCFCEKCGDIHTDLGCSKR